jgi:hypothetical protein
MAAGRCVHLLGAACLAGSALVLPGTALGRSPALRWRVALPSSPALAGLPRFVATRPYSWPLRPFNRRHPVRGGFGDPRFGWVQRNFHFGIDISAPGGTPVYAVAAGTVFLAPDRVDVLTVGNAKHATGFSYWHIRPAVDEHRFVPEHALIGWVIPAWGHLHFAELQDGSWVNPLRPGALTPYRDGAPPRINAIAIVPLTAPASAGEPVQGPIDITVDASVPTPLAAPAPWHDSPLAPTVIRWRLLADSVPVSPWTTAVDFRWSIPPNGMYDDVYAPGTTPNHPDHPGRYVFYLAHNWDLSTIAPGDYELDVQALGPHGSSTDATTELTVAAHVPPVAPQRSEPTATRGTAATQRGP